MLLILKIRIAESNSISENVEICWEKWQIRIFSFLKTVHALADAFSKIIGWFFARRSKTRFSTNCLNILKQSKHSLTLLSWVLWNMVLMPKWQSRFEWINLKFGVGVLQGQYYKMHSDFYWSECILILFSLYGFFQPYPFLTTVQARADAIFMIMGWFFCVKI